VRRVAGGTAHAAISRRRLAATHNLARGIVRATAALWDTRSVGILGHTAHGIARGTSARSKATPANARIVATRQLSSGLASAAGTIGAAKARGWGTRRLAATRGNSRQIAQSTQWLVQGRVQKGLRRRNRKAVSGHQDH
jgi:hypothetical protein